MGRPRKKNAKRKAISLRVNEKDEQIISELMEVAGTANRSEMILNILRDFHADCFGASE